MRLFKYEVIKPFFHKQILYFFKMIKLFFTDLKKKANKKKPTLNFFFTYNYLYDKNTHVFFKLGYNVDTIIKANASFVFKSMLQITQVTLDNFFIEFLVKKNTQTWFNLFSTFTKQKQHNYLSVFKLFWIVLFFFICFICL